jgi:hypothetical protein
VTGRVRGAWAVLIGRAKAVPPTSHSLSDLESRVALDKISELCDALSRAHGDIAHLVGIGWRDDERLQLAVEAQRRIDVALGRHPAEEASGG